MVERILDRMRGQRGGYASERAAMVARQLRPAASPTGNLAAMAEYPELFLGGQP
jgi:hypothetical protein